MGDALGPVAEIVEKGEHVDHLMIKGWVYSLELRVRKY